MHRWTSSHVIVGRGGGESWREREIEKEREENEKISERKKARERERLEGFMHSLPDNDTHTHTHTHVQYKCSPAYDFKRGFPQLYS